MRQAVGDREARERETLDRILRKNREAGGILGVVLDEFGVDADGLAEELSFLFGLVEIVAAAKMVKPVEIGRSNR